MIRCIANTSQNVQQTLFIIRSHQKATEYNGPFGRMPFSFNIESDRHIVADYIQPFAASESQKLQRRTDKASIQKTSSRYCLDIVLPKFRFTSSEHSLEFASEWQSEVRVILKGCKSLQSGSPFRTAASLTESHERNSFRRPPIRCRTIIWMETFHWKSW